MRGATEELEAPAKQSKSPLRPTRPNADLAFSIKGGQPRKKEEDGDGAGALLIRPDRNVKMQFNDCRQI